MGILLRTVPQVSGETATDEMKNDIIDSKNRGEVARDEFIQ